MRKRIISVIMGGGRGTRLRPLTQRRCKPAVPLAGKYRLVDIPISNCLNSGLNQIYVLSQFNTASLHRHIQESYKFDPFGGGFVDILSAEQTESGDSWYQGTADAVRQNLMHFGIRDSDLILILSGDQLYRMDFNPMIRQHVEGNADITVSATTVSKEQAPAFGLMRVEDDLSIAEFVEKPKEASLIESLVISKKLKASLDGEHKEDVCLASMGLYLFNVGVLREALKSSHTDFGKEIIPELLGKKKLHGYIFDGYWEDIGTVAAFFEANLRLTDEVPPFNFFDEENRIYSRARYLPATKINGARIERTIIADGCILSRCSLKRAVIGVRSVVEEGSTLENVVMMGSDAFENGRGEDFESDDSLSEIPVGVGRNCTIRNAIIDKNARIGEGVTLDPTGLPENYAKDGIVIRDGILVVPKKTTVPPGFILR
ncbi:MAG: glucose-1-phosphate adenylyltransferase [Verrucomicrobiota bacterium]